MSFRYEVFYLIEPRPELADALRGRIEPDFADVLLEPRLYRLEENSRTVWFEPQRLAQAKLMFLASLYQYAPLANDAGFAAVFGSGVVSVTLFDRWYIVRRFTIEDDLNLLENRLREVIDRVEPSGVPVVDSWLLDLRAQETTRGTFTPPEANES